MTHAEAFFCAIVEAPEDDTPRVVFADWLDEHGQPERAEFIRVQCASAVIRRALADPEPLPDCIAQVRRLTDYKRREAELVKLAGAWMEGIPFDRSRVIFDRGFVKRVSCSFFTLHVLDGAFAMQPIEEVKIDELEAPFRRQHGETAVQFRDRVKQEAGEQVAKALSAGLDAIRPTLAATVEGFGGFLSDFGRATRLAFSHLAEMVTEVAKKPRERK